jgi:O-6-methylguanine DNA methyltransferase
MARKPKPLPEHLYGSSIGWAGHVFRVLSSAKGVRFLALSDTPFGTLEKRLRARIVPDDSVNDRVLEQLHQYFRGERRVFELPLDLRGTVFQQAVWTALCAIPYGESKTYGQIAAAVGRPGAARAVGQAAAANPIPIIVPCHRMIGASGQLVGFGGGLPLKEKLLMLEQGALSL